MNHVPPTIGTVKSANLEVNMIGKISSGDIKKKRCGDNDNAILVAAKFKLEVSSNCVNGGQNNTNFLKMS
ncbi:hypothetical protein AGMMS5026_10580 [Endomicrobiia bacterium]|nr:hypothetical protein AGMMS49523_10980 [Endomicrobiia bacterium]GHT14613.1 hypothetical protein AGMMS49571_10600 [Endomicrobiia bacterium]GHT32497.1 hypothetical protein AGMMS5026_10580 [Endomicrobiia bacterium]